MFKYSFNKCLRFSQALGYAKYAQASDLKPAYNELNKSIRSSITLALKNRKILTVEEWKLLGNDLIIQYGFENQSKFNRIVFGVLLNQRPPHDSIENARKFIEANNMKYNLYIQRTMIQLYVKKAAEQTLTETEERELIELCNEFIAHGKHVSPEIHLILVNGYCATNEWRKAATISHQTNGSLNILIRKSLCKNEIDLALRLLLEIAGLKRELEHLSSETITAFVKYFDQHPGDIVKNVEKFLSICKELKMLFSESSCREFIEFLCKHGHHAHITDADSLTCANKPTDEPVGITDDDFLTLKTEFMRKIVIPSTNRMEWMRFEQMILKNGPFDIIMDGLNVAYSTNIKVDKHTGYTRKKPIPSGFMLADTVTQLKENGNRVLVIGRKHMFRWGGIDNLEKNANVYLVKNREKDDIFLLYAALCSGKNVKILSRDSMQDYKFAIGKQCEGIFELWLQEHRYKFRFVGDDDKLKLFRPIKLKMYTHKKDDFWNLPFKSDEETLDQNESPKNWACIRLIEQNLE